MQKFFSIRTLVVLSLAASIAHPVMAMEPEGSGVDTSQGSGEQYCKSPQVFQHLSSRYFGGKGIAKGLPQLPQGLRINWTDLKAEIKDGEDNSKLLPTHLVETLYDKFETEYAKVRGVAKVPFSASGIDVEVYEANENSELVKVDSPKKVEETPVKGDGGSLDADQLLHEAASKKVLLEKQEEREKEKERSSAPSEENLKMYLQAQLQLRSTSEFQFDNEFYIVEMNNKLNNPGDILILSCAGELLDSVTYGIWDDGNLADNAELPGVGQSALQR